MNMTKILLMGLLLLLLIVVGGVGATLLASLAFVLRPLSARPAQVLRDQE